MSSEDFSRIPAPTSPNTRAAAVAQELRRMIVAGELQPGERLRQLDVAAHFGFSTTPVREAFTILAREGLLHHDAHRGVVVSAPTPAELRERYLIRRALESLAAEIAAELITEDELRQLDELLIEMKVALKDDLARHTTELNPRFHAIIGQAARSPRLAELITAFRESVVTYHTLVVEPAADDDYLLRVHAEHAEIVAALREHHPARASEAVRVHVEGNLNRVLQSMSTER